MAAISDALVQGTPRRRRVPFVDFFARLIKEKPMGTVGGLIVLVFLLIAVLANVIAPHDPLQSDLAYKLQAPSSTHLMGTDNLGRDELSRVMFGARVSLYVGLGASFLNVVIATLAGLISGYVGGAFDLILQRFVDIALSIPSLVILISVVGIIGSGVWQIIVVMGVLGGILWTRVVRSAVISIRENVYLHASRATGGTTSHIILRHVFPNIIPIMVIIFSVSIAGNILAEAGLSFLGLGIPPPTPTWGGMLSGEGRSYMAVGWWLAVFPGLALSFVIYGVNMWGDAVRDLLDPRLRGGIGRYGNAAKKVSDLSRKEADRTIAATH